MTAIGATDNCRNCGIDLIYTDHDGWMSPEWVPFDGTTDSAYCSESDDGEHEPRG